VRDLEVLDAMARVSAPALPLDLLVGIEGDADRPVPDRMERHL